MSQTEDGSDSASAVEGGHTNRIIYERFAARHSLDFGKVSKVFEIFLSDDSFFADPIEYLNFAFNYLPQNHVMDLFIQDHQHAFFRVNLLMQILDPFQPFITFSNLNDNLDEYYSFIKGNMQHLLLTGYPAKEYPTLNWLDWNLTKSYFTKFPLSIQSNRNPHQQIIAEHDKKANYDANGFLLNDYTWGREGRIFEYQDVHISKYIPSGAETGFFIPCLLYETDDGNITPCEYSEAHNLEFMTDNEISLLEKARIKLLRYKSSLLKLASSLIESGKPLWPQASERMADYFSGTEIDKLLTIEKSIYSHLETSSRVARQKTTPGFMQNNGGLAQLIEFIKLYDHECETHLIGNLSSVFKKVEIKDLLIGDESTHDTLHNLYELFQKYNSSYSEFSDSFEKECDSFIKNETNEIFTIPVKRKYLADFPKHGPVVQKKLNDIIVEHFEPDKGESAKYLFAKNGNIWEVCFNDTKPIMYKDQIGLHYIQYLLMHPGERIDCKVLESYVKGIGQVREDAFDQVSESVDNGDMTITAKTGKNMQTIDRKEKEEIIKRLKELQAFEDDESLPEYRQKEIQEEIEQLKSYLGQTTYAGRIKSENPQDDRTRKRISKAIIRALEVIGQYDEKIFSHLYLSIRTGRSCIYRPPEKMTWIFEV